MLKVKLRILFIFLAAATTLSAGDFIVKIEGVFPGSEGKNIRLLKYAEQIAYAREEIADTTIDEDGLFYFSFRAYEPIYVFYRIDHARMGHYVEPGNNYRIVFEPVGFDTLDDRQNPYLNPWHFDFKLYNEEEQDNLNKAISAFNNIFDDFLLEHFSGVVRRRLNKPFENFRDHTDSLFQVEISEYPFFKDYYEYKYALYYRIANIKTPLSLFDDYIINRPVLYNNPQYMDFFNTVFDKYLIAGSRNITVNDLLTTVNRHGSYYALMDSLGKDTILRNEVLRELVMLKSLKDMYYHHDFSKRNVSSIIQYVHHHSKFPEHRNIAGNIINNFEHLEKGFPAPALELQGKSGEVISLDKFRGNFVLLNFWSTWCVPCLAEFSVMEELHEEHNERIAFVSVSVDRNEGEYTRFVNESNYPWKFFHFNDNFRMFDMYEVYRLPLYVLIDPQGNIVENVAPFPSRGLDRRIARILFEWDRNN